MRDAAARTPKKEVEIVWLSGNNKHYLPGTILLSVIGRRKDSPICNSRIKDDLARRGVIISIGSACNTASPTASHVLYAVGADDLVRRGALRISVGDTNTMDEAKRFIGEFFQALRTELERR